MPETLSTPLLAVHANIVVYALSFWLCQPVLPFLTKDLGADPLVFGWMQTVFSLVQLIGGPIMGRVIDTRGGRLALLISQTGAGVSYLLLALASTIPMLFASQLPTVTMHAMHAAQALVALLSAPDLRAAALGRLSLSYGVGMILGSLTGGTLSASIGHHGVALLAAGVSFSSIPLSLATLPRHVLPAASPQTGEEEKEEKKEKKETGLSLKEVLRLLKTKACRDLIVVQFLAGLGLSMQRSTFSVAAQSEFELDAQQLGFIMSYAAGIAVLVNTFLVGVFTSKLGEKGALTAALGLLSASFVAYGLTPSFELLLAVMVPMGVASTTMYTIASSAMTKVVAIEDAGTSIGLGHATRTLCGVVAPTAGGYLLAAYGFRPVGFASAALTGVAYVYMMVASPSLSSSSSPPSSPSSPAADKKTS